MPRRGALLALLAAVSARQTRDVAPVPAEQREDRHELHAAEKVDTAEGTALDWHTSDKVSGAWSNMEVCLDSIRYSEATLTEGVAVIGSFADKFAGRVKALQAAGAPLHKSFLWNSYVLQFALYRVVWTITSLTASPYFQLMSKAVDIMAQYASFKQVARGVAQNEFNPLRIADKAKKTWTMLAEETEEIDKEGQLKVAPYGSKEATASFAKGTHPIAIAAAWANANTPEPLTPPQLAKGMTDATKGTAALEAENMELRKQLSYERERKERGLAKSHQITNPIAALLGMTGKLQSAVEAQEEPAFERTAARKGAHRMRRRTAPAPAQPSLTPVAAHSFLETSLTLEPKLSPTFARPAQKKWSAPLPANITKLKNTKETAPAWPRAAVAEPWPSQDPPAPSKKLVETRSAAPKASPSPAVSPAPLTPMSPQEALAAYKAKAQEVSTMLEELREHLGWAWDGFSGILAFKSGTYDSRWCVGRALREIISYAPETMPRWFIDWFMVLYWTQRVLFHMIELAHLAPQTGLKQAYGLFRSVMNYLTLFWQAHATSTATKLGAGGAGVWDWLSAADLAKGLPG
tara:strand:+ start:1851 stop:3581 length:1731 start_codon:yes stop_codon:yes gene_type:complete